MYTRSKVCKIWSHLSFLWHVRLDCRSPTFLERVPRPLHCSHYPVSLKHVPQIITLPHYRSVFYHCVCRADTLTLWTTTWALSPTLIISQHQICRGSASRYNGILQICLFSPSHSACVSSQRWSRTVLGLICIAERFTPQKTRAAFIIVKCEMDLLPVFSSHNQQGTSD